MHTWTGFPHWSQTLFNATPQQGEITPLRFTNLHCLNFWTNNNIQDWTRRRLYLWHSIHCPKIRSLFQTVETVSNYIENFILKRWCNKGLAKQGQVQGVEIKKWKIRISLNQKRQWKIFKEYQAKEFNIFLFFKTVLKWKSCIKGKLNLSANAE